MNADSRELLLGSNEDETQTPFCSDLIFSSEEKTLLDWAVEPNCVSSLSFLCVCVCVQVRLPDSVLNVRL